MRFWACGLATEHISPPALTNQCARELLQAITQDATWIRHSTETTADLAWPVEVSWNHLWHQTVQVGKYWDGPLLEDLQALIVVICLRLCAVQEECPDVRVPFRSDSHLAEQ